MKNLIIIFGILLVSGFTLSAQIMVNDGANLVIKPNTMLVIQGDYINQSDGDILSDGIIRITGDWTNNATSGNLMQGSTGKVDFRGYQNQTIGGSAPTWFPKLDISQGPGQVKLESDISCSANLNISGRELLLSGHTIYAAAHVGVSTNGTLTVDSGAVVEMSDGKYFQAINTATANFYGTAYTPANIRSSSGYYFFEIQNGATIHAKHTIFENMELDGLELHGDISPVNAFHNCTFRYGRTDGVLITFDNPDPVSINNAQFPENTWGSNYNVTKLNDEGRVTFNDAVGNFAGEWYEDDPNNSIDWNNTIMEHEVSLEEGWSGISSWLVPGGEDITVPFAPILEHLIIALTLDGMYFPAQNINTIGAWESHDAFIIKMNEDIEFPLLGVPEANYTVQLNQGWTLLPVVTPCPVNCDELFSGIGWTFEIAKEIAGTKVFWPDMGIYTLDEIHPGKGYLVRSSDPIPLLFPQPNCDGFDGFAQTEEIPIKHPWSKVTRSSISHTIGFPEKITNQFIEGDIIGVFTSNGACAGVAKVQKGLPLALTTFADDSYTSEKDGFSDGEMMTFRKYAPDLKKESAFYVIFDTELSDADGLFHSNGLSVVKELIMGPAGVGDEFAAQDVSIHPNPNTGHFTISGISGASHIKLTDSRGIEVFENILSNNNTLEFDLSSQPKGIYFIRAFFPEKVETIKVILK